MQLILVLVAVAGLTFARLALDPVLGNRAPFMFHLIGLFGIALLVGKWPYLMAAALAIGSCAVLFVEPRGAVLGAAGANVQLAIYAVGAALVPLAAWPARSAYTRVLRKHERIQADDQRFRLALDHSQVTLYTTDLDLCTTWVYNPQPQFRTDELIGRSAEEVFGGESGEEFTALYLEVLRSGRLIRRVVSGSMKGERIVCDVTAEPIRDAGGGVTGIAAAASDITAGVRAAEELRAAQQDLSRLWHQCSMACEAGQMGEWVWNVGEERVWWSRSMCEIMGRKAAGSEGTKLSVDEMMMFIHPEDRERKRDAMQRLLVEGGDVLLELRLVQNAPAGGEKWIELRGRLERDEDGRATSMIGVALDITQHRVSHDAMAKQAAMLVRSNDDLEDFAHIVSHNLKEPLRGISNFASFVLEDEGARMTQDGRERMETIQRLGSRLSEHLDALLQYSRVGRAELAVHLTSVRTVARMAVERLELWLKEQSAVVEIDHDLPEVHCDCTRLEEALVNLIANGVKYNDSPQKRIRVGARPDGSIYVEDNGIGIEARHAGTIFEMFRRLHGRDAYGGGTGSGLAITKKIIERHGGRLWVESQPGCGSRFWFTLGAVSSEAGVAMGCCSGSAAAM